MISVDVTSKSIFFRSLLDAVKPRLFSQTGFVCKCDRFSINRGILAVPQHLAELHGVRVSLGREDQHLTEAVQTEDIPQGLSGAKAGGFFTVAVEDPFSEKERETLLALADRYIGSFRELL